MIRAPIVYPPHVWEQPRPVDSDWRMVPCVPKTVIVTLTIVIRMDIVTELNPPLTLKTYVPTMPCVVIQTLDTYVTAALAYVYHNVPVMATVPPATNV